MQPEHWLYTIPLRLRSLFRRKQVDQELDDEFRDHVERKTDEYVAKGMSPQEARRQSFLEMGGIEQRKEACRDTRRVNWLQDLLQDLSLRPPHAPQISRFRRRLHVPAIPTVWVLACTEL